MAFKRILPLVLACLMLAGCSAAPKGDRAEFDAFAAQVNGARSADPEWTGEERAALAAVTPDFEDLPAELVEQVTKARRSKQELDPEEAGRDVSAFFTLLRGAYSGYDYFGGDPVFLPIRDRLLAEVAAVPTWTTAGLEALLADALDPVVADGHFWIGSRDLWRSHSLEMYYVPDLYLSDPTGLDPALVKPTVGPDGAITHCFAALSADGADLPRTALVEGEETALDWRRAEPYEVQDRVAFRREVKSGIPVVTSRTMTANERNAEELMDFSNAGALDRDAPVVLLDIRGNGGGNSGYGSGWVAGLTGQPSQYKWLHANKESQLYVRFMESFGMETPDSTGQWNVFDLDGIVAPREGVALVLMDRGTASAAEDLVQSMQWVDNAVFIGSNTMGCAMFGNVVSCKLPDSRLRIQFGTSMNWCGTRENIEGVGFMPDLWVPPQDGLDAALRLCRYYGLDRG